MLVGGIARDFLGLSGNNQAVAIVVTYTAAEPMSALKAVYSDSPTSVKLAIGNDTFEKAHAIGITLNAAIVNESVKVLIFGAWDDPSFHFSQNAVLFLSDAAGEIVTTAQRPGFQTRVGYGLGEGRVFVNPDEPIQLA